ncbi:MAG: acyltransferase [Clostridiales bacterium]|nr:acyltransferase [Clostridiales bacterium]
MSNLANKSLISRSSTSALKIIFQVMVLFHHLYLCSTEFGRHVSAMAGPVAVGGFLILSGYGVGLSYKKSGEEYSHKLLFKRVPSTYLMLFITNICYLALYFYMGSKFDNLFDLAVSVLYLPIFDGFVALSHYVYFLADLIIYYIMFLLFSHLFRKQKNGLTITAAAMCAVLIIVIIVLSIINAKTGSSRYLRACLCFPFGLTCACFDQPLVKFFKKFKWFIVAILFIVGVIVYWFGANKTANEYAVPVLVGLAIVLAFSGCEFKSKIIEYFASLMLYVYLSHELFRELLIYEFPNMHQNVRAIIVVALSLLIAIIITTLINFISKKSKKKEKNA